MRVNNVTRLLDSRKIKYQAFELPEQKMGGEDAARLMEVDPGIVFKSIVLLRKGPGKPILAVVPGNQDVDLKKLAKILGEKKVSPATQREAEQLTGLLTGGISPLALLNRGFEIVIHSSIQDLDQVHISGGERGLNIRLASQDLVRLVPSRIADIC